VLPPHISAYYAAPAGSEADLDEGTLDWSAIRFRPRVLRDIALPTLSTTVLGTPRTDTGSGRADGPANPPQTESVDCYSTISSTSASVLDPGRVRSPTHSSAS
jgi:hypothetical protein